MHDSSRTPCVIPSSPVTSAPAFHADSSEQEKNLDMLRTA